MFPWMMIAFTLGPGIIFACWCVYYLMKIAHQELEEDRQIL